MNKVLVCPVAFNENLKVERVIQRFLDCDVKDQVDYLIVDDASTDGTTEVIGRFAGQGVKTIKHDRRCGVGTAIRTAIQYARKEKYDVLVIMAGNDKDDPREIPHLIDPIFDEDYDFVQGSRYVGVDRIGGDMPLYRKVATRIHPALMSMMTGRRLRDTTNGFRAFKLSMFAHKDIDIDQSWLDQYELEPYLLYKALMLGFKFKEAPVTKIYPDKKLGYTKMRPFSGWWSILRPLVYLALKIKK